MNTSISHQTTLELAYPTALLEENSARFGHAIVVGSGITGLTAARVLTDYFNQVTIIDRDVLPDPVEFRRGVPQARHAHRLLPRASMSARTILTTVGKH